MGLIRDIPRQGDVWWVEAEHKRRPVLVVSRTEAAGRLNRLIVAPVTTTVRGIPTEIALGRAEGLPRDCAASFDNLTPQRANLLTSRVGRLAFAQRRICSALEALADR